VVDTDLLAALWTLVARRRRLTHLTEAGDAHVVSVGVDPHEPTGGVGVDGRETYPRRTRRPLVNETRLLLGLAGVLAGIAVLDVALGLVYSPVLVVVAVPFGLAAVLVWYHASGRMARHVRWRARRVGPSEPSVGGDERVGRGAHGRDAEAFRTLGLEPGASDQAVQRAYRERAKEVHPDAPGGDTAAFKRVTRAYERLRD